MQKLLDQFVTKFLGRVAHVPWKKALDFGGNQNHVRDVMLGLM